MTQLDPEETAALAAGTASISPKGEVSPRDFREPKSLSAEQLHQAHGLINSTLQALAAGLAAPLRSFHRVHLASLRELNVEHLFDDYEAPFFVHQFQVEGEHAWAVWDSAVAGRAIDAIVTGAEISDEEADARMLSRAETGVLGRILNGVIKAVTDGLGLQSEPGKIAQDLDQLVTLDSAGPGADARRLQVHLVIEGALGRSELVLYLPGVSAAPLPVTQASPDLPEHLDEVMLDIRAFLGAVDLPLSELLALEIGDVLPLHVEVDTPLDIYVEERSCAKGVWGQVGGTLAVRLDQLDLHPGDIDCPESPSNHD